MRARLACLLSLSTHCRQVPYLFKASFILGIYQSENRRRIYKSYRRMRRPTSYFENTALYSFFISLSYPDLSRCDIDDGTRTLDPHWWRVNKPSLGVPEALLDYRPKEGWLKGILINRKSRGKTA